MGMLALERQVSQQIIIDTTGIKPGELIKIMVLNVRGDIRSAKIGVDCPRQCAVHREEIYEEIQREKRLMATAGKS